MNMTQPEFARFVLSESESAAARSSKPLGSNANSRCDDQLTTRLRSPPRKDKRGVDLIFDALPFGRLWYEDASAAVDYAKRSSRLHDAGIRVYDERW